MITIIHGDDTISSQKKLDSLLQQNEWIIRLDGEKQKAIDVHLAYEGQELFEAKKTILIEHIQKFAKKDLDEVLTILNAHIDDESKHTLIWSDSSFDKRFLEKLKGVQVYEFPLPKYFYAFLDGFFPSNKKTLHDLLNKLSHDFAAEQIFYALVKRIRLLMLIKSGNEHDFAEIVQMSPWQLSKLKNQAKSWSTQKVITCYQSLFSLELKRKTGELPLSLFEHLDLLVVREL